MRRQTLQAAPLLHRLPGQHHPALGQIAQAPVDQLGGAGGGASGEVCALDQPDAQAPRGGVPGHARAGNSPAHHEDVEVFPAEAFELRHAVPQHTPILPSAGNPGRGIRGARDPTRRAGQ